MDVTVNEQTMNMPMELTTSGAILKWFGYDTEKYMLAVSNDIIYREQADIINLHNHNKFFAVYVGPCVNG